MDKYQENILPKFYEEEGEKVGSGYEAMMDFNLRWLLRCADDKYKGVNPSLIHEYAKHTVFFLIYGNNDNKEDVFAYDCREISKEFKVERINVFRQFHSIDLLVEVDIKDKTESNTYILNIENKFDASVTQKQLEKYRKDIEENEYKGKEITIRNLCIFNEDSRYEKGMQEICKNNNYKFLNLQEIAEFAKMEKKTGNALFDEFWFHF